MSTSRGGSPVDLKAVSLTGRWIALGIQEVPHLLVSRLRKIVVRSERGLRRLRPRPSPAPRTRERPACAPEKHRAARRVRGPLQNRRVPRHAAAPGREHLTDWRKPPISPRAGGRHRCDCETVAASCLLPSPSAKLSSDERSDGCVGFNLVCVSLRSYRAQAESRVGSPGGGRRAWVACSKP